MKMPKKIGKLNNRGVTLMEVIVVIAMIGILTGIAMVGVNTYKTTAEEAEAKAEAMAVYLATQVVMIDDYQNNTDDMPPQITEASPLEVAGGGSKGAVSIAENSGLGNLPAGKIVKLGRESKTKDDPKAYSQIRLFEYIESTGKYKVTITPKAISENEQATVTKVE